MLRRTALAFVVAAAAFGTWRFVAARPAPVKSLRAAMSPEEWRYIHSQTPHWRALALKR